MFFDNWFLFFWFFITTCTDDVPKMRKCRKDSKSWVDSVHDFVEEGLKNNFNWNDFTVYDWYFRLSLTQCLILKRKIHFMIKFSYSEKFTKFWKNHLSIFLNLPTSIGRFLQILLTSQNIWTLRKGNPLEGFQLHNCTHPKTVNRYKLYPGFGCITMSCHDSAQFFERKPSILGPVTKPTL